MIYLHILMAILATWRITEAITQDRISDNFRKRFPTYLWSCPRCVSVWAGAWCAAMFALGPISHWLTAYIGLWPFALGWLYLWHNEYVLTRRMAKQGRRLIVEVSPTGNATFKNELNNQEISQILPALMRPATPPSAANGQAPTA